MFGWYWNKTWVFKVQVFRKLVEATEKYFGVLVTHGSKGFGCSVESYSTIEGEDGSGCSKG